MNDLIKIPDEIPDSKLVKQYLEIQTLQRQAQLTKIEDVLAFVAMKSTGGVFLISGVLEILSPDFILAVIPNPMAFAGVGLALLTGKKAASKILDALKKSME